MNNISKLVEKSITYHTWASRPLSIQCIRILYRNWKNTKTKLLFPPTLAPIFGDRNLLRFSTVSLSQKNVLENKKNKWNTGIYHLGTAGVEKTLPSIRVFQKLQTASISRWKQGVPGLGMENNVKQEKNILDRMPHIFENTKKQAGAELC